MWAFLWEKLGYGYFYLLSYIVSGGLLYFFNDTPRSVKKVINTLVVDAAVVGVYYVLFNVIVQLRL